MKWKMVKTKNIILFVGYRDKFWIFFEAALSPACLREESGRGETEFCIRSMLKIWCWIRADIRAKWTHGYQRRYWRPHLSMFTLHKNPRCFQFPPRDRKRWWELLVQVLLFVCYWLKELNCSLEPHESSFNWPQRNEILIAIPILFSNNFHSIEIQPFWISVIVVMCCLLRDGTRKRNAKQHAISDDKPIAIHGG